MAMAVSRYRSLLLAVLASSFLPISIGLLIFNYAVLVLTARNKLRKRLRRTPGFECKKIVITGVDTPYGLRLARAFYEVGHDVVGADYQEGPIPTHARWSIALLKIRRLKARTESGRARELQSLVQTEAADLWIDCSRTTPLSTLIEAKHLIEQSSSCICFVPPDHVVASIQNASAFLDFAQKHGLPVPDSHRVQSRDDIHKVLNQTRGKRRYVLTSPSSPTAANSQTLLPRRTLSQTYNDVSKINMQQSTQWLLEQYIESMPRYTAFSLLLNGQVQAFSACQQRDSSTWRVLSSTTLKSAMRKYLSSLAEHLGQDVTSHLSVDFCVEERVTDTGVEQRLLPVSGSLRPETPSLLFEGTAGSVDLVRSYLKALLSSANGHSPSLAVRTNGHFEPEEQSLHPIARSTDLYSFGNETYRFLDSIFRFLKFKSRVSDITNSALTFTRHIIVDKELMYDFNDPLPFWYLYQIYIPARLLLNF